MESTTDREARPVPPDDEVREDVHAVLELLDVPTESPPGRQKTLLTLGGIVGVVLSVPLLGAGGTWKLLVGTGVLLVGAAMLGVAGLSESNWRRLRTLVGTALRRGLSVRETALTIGGVPSLRGIRFEGWFAHAQRRVEQAPVPVTTSIAPPPDHGAQAGEPSVPDDQLLPFGLPGVASAVVGLLALSVAARPYIGLVGGPPLGLVALGLGVVGLVRPARRRWPAVVGLVLTGMTLIVWLLWWAAFSGAGSSTAAVELEVQPLPSSMSAPPQPASPSAATTPSGEGRAVLEVGGKATSFDVTGCHIDARERTVEVVSDAGALAVSWVPGGGVLALDVWDGATGPRRYLGALMGMRLQRGGDLPLRSGPSYELRGSLRDGDTGATVPVDLHVECG